MGDQNLDENLEHGFTTGIFVLHHTTQKLNAAEAERSFGEVSKENFWRMWPHVRDWAEELWKHIDDERGHMATPVEDDEYDEVGGGG
jgi:hypothetical protein